jgi:hypothetical protein
MKHPIILAAILSSLTLVACGGGGARTTNEITSVTRGQELLDLKKAFDAGALSEREYEQQRRQILERRN